MANIKDPVAAIREKMGISTQQETQTSATDSHAQSGSGDPVADVRKKIGIYTPQNDNETNEILKELTERTAGISDYLNSDAPLSWEERSRYQDQITGARNQLQRLSDIYGADAVRQYSDWYSDANSSIAQKTAYQRWQAETERIKTEEPETYLQALLAQGYEPGSQVVQSYARAHGLTVPETGAAKVDNRTKTQKAFDRFLGVDRTQVTGEDTNWWDIFKGSALKGLSQWSTSMWKGADWLLGDLAEDIHQLGVITINDVIDGLNYIPGVDLDYIDGGRNFIRWGREESEAYSQYNQQRFSANANTSRAAQIADVFGTSFFAAVPMAIEALMFGLAGAGGEMATTEGLTYFSGLQSASSAEAVGQMAAHAHTEMLKNPQFWTTYVQTVGDGYDDAKADGMSDIDAGLYAMINAYWNAMIEIGGSPDSGLGGVQNFAMKIAEAEETGNKKLLVDWFKDSVLGEGWEEVLQGIFERGLKAPVTGDPLVSFDVDDTRAVINPFTAGQEFAGGAVVGGLLGGVQLGVKGGLDAATGKTHGNVQNLTQVQERGPQQSEATPAQTQQDTGAALIQQVIHNMDVPEAQAQVLAEGFEAGNADAQSYALGIQEAFRLGEMGVSFEQALENSSYSDKLNEAQFRHAWEIGAQKAGQSTETRAQTVARQALPEYESIEAFSREFKSPEHVTAIFDQAADTDVNAFAEGFRAAYDMGQSGVSANYLTQSSKDGAPYVPTLTPEQAKAAYEMGRTDAENTALDRTTSAAAKQKAGNLTRVKGTVRGDGVTIADMRKAFNDRQNTAYRLLTRYAETTGVNIVLYNSQADAANGLYPAAQGRFQWKDDTIYIDINSGVSGIQSAGDLGQYTMLRTFAHEFTHFIEKWNATQYNEFREFVFSTMEAKGQNVHDLIETKQAQDASGNMTYEQASREVVADAMMDILPDSTLVQQLASEHRTIFNKLLEKMREFVARVKQYYRGISSTIPEAQMLKENGAYMESIVQMWDEIAKGAVANYQAANGDVLVDQPAKPADLPKRSELKQVQLATDTNVLAKEEPPAATGEKFTRAEQAPQKEQEAQAAEEEPETPAEAEKPAAEEAGTPEAQTERPAVTPKGEKLRNRLDAGDSVDYNGFRYEIFGMKSVTVDLNRGGTSTGTEYRGTIRRVSTGGIPIADGRTIFDRTFDNRADAVDYMVSVAENNHLLEEKAEPKQAKPAAEKPASEKAAKQPESSFPLLAWKKGTPSQRVAYSILTEHLRPGKGMPSTALYAICDKAFGGTQAEGKYNRKDAYDAMELAVNQYITEVMRGYNEGTVENARRGIELAQKILSILPTQNVRTQEQLDYQQFSTPPSIAYLTAWAANINNQDHVLEPSAGIGGLASFAKAWGAKVTVNELSKRRFDILLSMGFDYAFNENAEHIHDVLPDEIKPTVVIMNPPFSSTAGRTKSNKTSNAEAHINSALDRLADGGRLVAVLGRGMADDKYTKYWNKVRQEYTIRANIGIDGKNYTKYGTSFDVQIVVIDKVGPQGSTKTVTGQFAELSQIPAVLEGIRNDRSAEVKQQSRVASDSEAVAAEQGKEQSVPPAVDETSPADRGGRQSDRRDHGRGRSGQSGNADVQQPGRSAETVRDAGASERGAVEQPRVAAEDRGGRKAERPASGVLHEEGGTGAVADVQGESGQQRRGSETELARGRQVEVSDDGVYATYQPPALTTTGSRAHPATLVESAAMAAVEMPKATYTPHLPDTVVKNNLSDAQMVSITYAGQAHEQTLPSGERRGFFIGDGTGVGKGRQISGIILDNFMQGRKKAIWISEKQSLYNDAQRDWTDTTGRSKDEIKSLAKVKVENKIDYPEGVVFTTYDTLRGGSKAKSRVEQLADWFGKDYDGVIAFDEAHNMGNLLGKQGARGKSTGSAKAKAAVELQRLLPNARVVYVSATAATEVDGLAFASRLGLWGKSTAFSDVKDFVSKIGSAGLSAMELVVRDMKAMGMYVARSISYNGVEYNTIQHDLDPIQTQIYNTMSRAWQKTMRQVEQSLADTGAQHNSQAKSLAIGQYYNAIQRFYNQVLTSMAMPSVIADMRKQLASGKSCVLQIVNTNQAEADRQMASIKAEGGELDDMDLTPRGTLINYLMECYPVTKFEEYEDEDGNTRSRPVLNSQGEPVFDKKAVAKRDALIEEINQMSIPDGPLEMLFDAFGTENVAEITGRTRRVVPRKQHDGTVKRVEEARAANSKEADVTAFQNGDKRILVFNNAGGTGKSYHADNRAKNRQQRVHYVLQPGWEASRAVQGFGRTHRSNEASAPIYKLVTTNIKGQKRFTSTIARRLDQLGALTKGQRDTGSGMFGASDNLETDLAKDSLREFYRRLGMNKLEGIDGKAVLQKLGLLEKFTGEYGEFRMNDAVARDISKFLNRILALEVDEQNEVFDAFINIYETEMEAAIAAGTLDRGMENVKADKIEIVDDKVIHEQKGTGAATHYVQAKVYTKPKIITTVAEAEGARSGFVGIYKTKDGDVRAVYRIADKTTEWGAITKQYKLQSPNRSKSSVWQERTLENNAEMLPKAEWQSAWDEEVKKVPEYNEEVKHMLTGSLLPIWDALPEEGNTKVRRLITSDGKAYLGRIINGEQIDNVLRRFDVNRTKEKYTGKSLMQKALSSSTVFQLTYYRAKLFRSRVSGEWRLEYVQPQNSMFVQQQYPGIIMERISYQNRFFIPNNATGEAILDKILENNPVSNVAERNEDTVQYSIRRTENIPYEDQVGAMFGEKAAKLNRGDDLYVHGAVKTGINTGLDGKPFFMLKRNFDKITRQEAKNANYSAHGIDEKTMRKIPDLLETPALYVVGNGRISVITDEYVKTKKSEAAPLLIGIDPNARVDGRPANEIKSIYGRDGFVEWLKLRAADSTIYAGDEKKAAALLRDVGLNMAEPVAYAANLTERILAAPIENVNTEDEYSTRQQSLSNREILSMAANDIDIDTLDDRQRNALNIFNNVLNDLRAEQEHRAELGRQYKEQQFTKGGSRQEADRIRAAMSVSDSKIKALENRLLSLENKDVLKSVLEKARRVVELEERKRGNETLKRYRERRNESAAVHKYRERVRTEVETLRKWLVNPSNKDVRKHVPAEIQKTVADFLDSINLMSKTALRTSGLDTTKADEKYLKNMKKLRDAIKKNVDTHGLYSGYADLPEGFIDTFEALIRKTEEHIGDHSGVFVVNQMSAAELRELSHALKTLKKYITTMNEFHNNAMFQHAYDAGEETVDYLSKFAKSKKSGFVHKFFSMDYMRPSYVFERFGKGGQSIEHEFREGQATQAFLANKIIDFAKETYTAKEVKSWGETVKSFTLSDGETVKVPITHIMSLYCLNKRPQALTHIYGDGIRIANYKDGRHVELDEGHLVTLGDVQEMISTLTPRQREVADALQKYMSTDTATWGNYVSMARFGVEQFTEENYFPINSDGRYLAATADETPDNAGLYALLNSSFTKELKENANNRIILYNIFDVFANHTASMTQYRSFALPVLDALKWFNYQNDTTSVRSKLSSAFGAPVDERAGSGSKGYAEQFVINLLRAYNGTAAQGDPYDSVGMKALHRFNRAQIAFNFRVVVQQPMAITRAAMLLSPAKLAKGLGMSAEQMKKLAAEMEEHSGIAAWKALGFYDTNISRGLTELIKQNPSFMDQVTEVGTKGAEVADRFTWAAMWYAAKDTVKRSDYDSEEAYYKAVTELFEDVIYKTQVVDSVLTKSEFLRAKGFFPRMLGSFMSEPMTTTSMLTSAYYKYSDDMQRGMSRSEAWKKNGPLFAKTAAVYTIGQVMLAAAQAVIDAWRDDDEYDAENWLNNFFQKYLKAFKRNAVEEILPFGKVPILSELYEALKSLLDYAGVFEKIGLDLYGNDISNGWAQYAKYLKKGFEIIIDLIQGNKTNYTAYGAIYNFLRGVAGATGFPIATAWRELQDMWNNTVGYFAPNLKLDTYQRAIDRQYIEQIRPTGLSQKTFESILADADARGDGNGSLKQDELGAELVAAIGRGEITEDQADAIWRTKWNKPTSKTFAKWREETGGVAPAPKPAAMPATASTPAPAASASTGLSGYTPLQSSAPAATPAPTQEPQVVTSFEQFNSTAPLYGSDRRQASYAVWENSLQYSGMSLDRYTEILTMADMDGNGSLKQDELGYTLRACINNGEMTYEQAYAVWNAQGWSHNFDYWSGRH